jgi:hypothetical protein
MSKSGKGSSFERDMARAFSEWWTHGERDDVFWRVKGSGGRATVRAKGGRQTLGQHGDLCATDPIAMPFIKAFTVEFKRGYKDWSAMDALDRPARSKPSQFEKFIEQAIRQQKEARTPFFLLVTKKDRREPLVFTNHFLSLIADHPCVKLWIGSTRPVIRCSPLKNFFRLVTPEEVTQIAAQQIQ